MKYKIENLITAVTAVTAVNANVTAENVRAGTIHNHFLMSECD